MAKNKESQNKKFTDKKNIGWMIFGGILVAGSVALGVLSMPFSGIPARFTFGFSFIISCVALALGTTIMSISGAKHRKAKKIFKKAQKEKEVVAEEKPELIQERENHLANEILKKKEENAEEKKEVAPEYKINITEASTPSMNEFRTDTIGPNTFAIYEKDGKTLLKDEHGNNMIYSISSDNRFRAALNGLAKEFSSLSDCQIVVHDAEDKKTDHNVSDKTYRKDMLSVYNDIKTVRSSVGEKEYTINL